MLAERAASRQLRRSCQCWMSITSRAGSARVSTRAHEVSCRPMYQLLTASKSPASTSSARAGKSVVGRPVVRLGAVDRHARPALQDQDQKAEPSTSISIPLGSASSGGGGLVRDERRDALVELDHAVVAGMGADAHVGDLGARPSLRHRWAARRRTGPGRLTARCSASASVSHWTARSAVPRWAER